MGAEDSPQTPAAPTPGEGDGTSPKVGQATQKVEKRKMAGRRASLIPGELELMKKRKALEEKIKSGQVAKLNLETEEKDEMKEDMEREAQLFTARRAQTVDHGLTSSGGTTTWTRSGTSPRTPASISTR